MSFDAFIDNVTSDIEKLDFHHPFTPYDVQEQFMRAVYDVLEAGDGQVGILESPTGTVRVARLWDAFLITLRANRYRSSVHH